MAAEANIVIREDKGFWWVWTKTGRMPRRFHNSAESAETEAKRLALAHPGKKFIVLHAYAKFSALECGTVEAQAA